jgi:hypothetical protein
MGTISVGLLVISATVLAGTSAFGQAALPKSISACAAIDDDAKRLACYDSAVSAIDLATAQTMEARKVAAQVRTKAAAEKAEADRVAALAAAEKAKVDNFGAVSVPKTLRPASESAVDIDNLEAAIAEFFYSPSKALIVVLDNGQMWRQKDSESMPPIRAGDKVRIQKRMISGFRMTFIRQKRTIDVTRFK